MPENRRVHDGRVAPTLMVKYQCPECFAVAAMDAYKGPPSCIGSVLEMHAVTFMEALAIVRDESQPGPLADIEKMRSTPRAYV